MTPDPAAELARWQGKGLKPQRGCAFARLSLGDAEVLVEYEYTPGEPPVYNLDSPMCGPGCGPEVAILNVLINGEMCDAEDVIPEHVLDRWRDELIETEDQVARDQKEEAMAARYSWRIDE
jgi:hypothetical protein